METEMKKLIVIYKYRHAVSALLVMFATITMAAKQPNIIVILADDMGVDSVSAFNTELGFRTPRIDKLVNQGMVFTDGHSGSGVCTPTRNGLLTGRYSWRSRLKAHIVPRWDAPLIEEGRITLASMLKTKGYNTAAIGKWRLGWNWPFKSTVPVPVGNGVTVHEKSRTGSGARRFVRGNVEA